MLNKVDEILNDLIELAYEEVKQVKSKKGYFSKDFVEACGIVVSLAYGREKNDK